MDPYLLKVIAVILSAILSYEAYKLQCLTRDGALASWIVGSSVGVFGSISAFFLLTAFTILGFVATLKDFNKKKEAGVQEGVSGERTWKNVMGVGLPPILVVLINFIHPLDPALFAVLFISTITVAGADTIASEVGSTAPKVYMITTLKPTTPGINGGVSVRGTVVSTIASLAIALIGWFVITESLEPMLLVPFVAGVFGNIMDSVLGAVLENPGYISKYTNNCVTSILGAVFGMALFFCVA